jgi:TPR repeat protein
MRKFLLSLFLVVAMAPVSNAENHLNELNVDESFRAAVKLVESKQYIDAISIFTILAEQEIPEAQFNLSLLLFNGLGAPKNYKASLSWAWKAHLNEHEAALGQVNAILDLVTPELQNTVAEQLIEEFTELAKAGDQMATVKLGMTYTDLLVEPNNLDAYTWLSIGQAYGIEKASSLLTEVTDLLTIEEILVQQDAASRIFTELR